VLRVDGQAERCGARRRGWARAASVLAAVALLGLTGCVYLRLLAVQRQFARFDQYIRVLDEGGLTLQFIEPVLLTEDFTTLLNTAPSAVQTNGNRLDWQWTFAKSAVTHETAGAYDITFTTSFVSNRFARMTFPPRFLSMMPKAYIVQVLRGLGGAEIQRQEKKATLNWAGMVSEPGQAPPPPLVRARIVQLLGQPVQVLPAAEQDIWWYRYRLRTESRVKEATRQAWIRFTFPKRDLPLQRAEASFAGHQLEIGF